MKRERIWRSSNSLWKFWIISDAKWPPPRIWWEAAHKRAQELESCREDQGGDEAGSHIQPGSPEVFENNHPLKDISQKLPQNPYFLLTHNCSFSKHITAALFKQILCLDCLNDTFVSGSYLLLS